MPPATLAASNEVVIDDSAVSEFGELAAGLVGRNADARQALLTKALHLLSVAEIPDRAALFQAPPGRVLVQEQFSAKLVRPFEPGLRVTAATQLSPAEPPTAPFVLEARLSQAVGPDGSETIAALKATLRNAAPSSMALPGPLAARVMAGADTPCMSTECIGTPEVGRYLTLVNDPNPVHYDRTFASSVGLPGPVVPGGFLLAMTEPVLAVFFPGRALRELTMRFVAPTLVGDALAIYAEVRRLRDDGDINVRLVFVRRGCEIVSVSDVRLRSALDARDGSSGHFPPALRPAG